jgi:hypothetical protein
MLQRVSTGLSSSFGQRSRSRGCVIVRRSIKLGVSARDASSKYRARPRMIHSELGRDRPNLTMRAVKREILANRSALNRELGNLIHITILLDDPTHGMCLIRQRGTRLP